MARTWAEVVRKNRAQKLGLWQMADLAIFSIYQWVMLDSYIRDSSAEA